ncbi:LysR family transcriptional regulator [Microterricola pindariensis]|uniref:HTH lysR-type domain-containing protein n=1 Tax=Microterricola pindariensis TaxID=478010 RepID=A0ABX5AZ78_9MICO|nr:LysR substrate-binding domain-containing protein [Microterricola pindariensis]PPL20223.1 hypothetical protein GY24_01370 [Microterricola pindariensis]
MEIQQMRAFLMVASELHFGRAAQKLFTTQPALSRTIKGLEQSLGERLFERSTRSTTLTAAGRALVGPGRSFLDAHDRATESVAQAASGAVGTINLGFAGASSHLMVSRLLRSIVEGHPGIQVNLFSSNFARVGLEKLFDGEFDLALGRWAAIPAGIETKTLALEYIVLAVAESHPLAQQGTVRFADVAHERFIMLPDHPGAVLRDRLFELSRMVGTTPDVRQIAPDTWTVLALVSENLGVTLTLSTVRDSTWFPGVVFLELEDAIGTADLSLAWRSPVSNPAVSVAVDVAAVAFPLVVPKKTDAQNA